MDSAPEWVGRQHPDSLFVSSNGQAIRPESSPGYCLDHPEVRQSGPRLLRGGRAARRGQPRVPRLRPVERAPRHQLGEPDLHPEPRVLLLPEHRGALPPVADAEVRHARRPERRVVPPPRVVGRGRAQPAQHDPLVHRLHRLEAVHRRQAGRGPARAVPGGQARRPGSRGDEPRRGGGALLLAPLLGGPVGRLDDGRAGRLLRDVLLPEALGLRGPGRRVARGAARLRAVLRLRERPPGFLDRRAAGGVRDDRAERRPDGDAFGPADLDLERARARGEGHLHLRVLPDEHRLRVGRLRPRAAGRHAHGASEDGGRDRAPRGSPLGALP